MYAKTVANGRFPIQPPAVAVFSNRAESPAISCHGRPTRPDSDLNKLDGAPLDWTNWTQSMIYIITELKLCYSLAMLGIEPETYHFLSKKATSRPFPGGSFSILFTLLWISIIYPAKRVINKDFCQQPSPRQILYLKFRKHVFL